MLPKLTCQADGSQAGVATTGAVATSQLDCDEEADDDDAVVSDWMESVKQPDPHFTITATTAAKLKKELESMKSSILEQNAEGCVHIKVCLAAHTVLSLACMVVLL